MISSYPLADTPDQHGFVMIGTETLFLHHLAMFNMENHRYQLLMQVSLPAYAKRAYVADKAAQPPGTTYILGNLQTDLMTIPQIANGQRVAFSADIFRGLPNDPNTDPPLIHNVPVQIERIVIFRRFDYCMDYPPYLTYYLFGAGTSAHLVHWTSQLPDFDQVLDLLEVPAWLDPEHLASGVTINFLSLPQQFYTSNPLTAPAYSVSVGGIGEYLADIGVTSYFDTAAINMVHEPPGSEQLHAIHRANAELGGRA
ncbi:hypothetical protein [Dyella flagellata]|uniref:Uncharacterized protein n=1 Tax=Dyella flagellata TaxID=1867833 RepID=A0ABQ5XJA7_9GAMM|nr:hypothetical protein [Dyella flagellata]GLQ90615.1 hypothetical protein GCM10007898_41910 [Dyella flagellata]